MSIGVTECPRTSLSRTVGDGDKFMVTYSNSLVPKLVVFKLKRDTIWSQKEEIGVYMNTKIHPGNLHRECQTSHRKNQMVGNRRYKNTSQNQRQHECKRVPEPSYSVPSEGLPRDWWTVYVSSKRRPREGVQAIRHPKQYTSKINVIQTQKFGPKFLCLVYYNRNLPLQKFSLKKPKTLDTSS